MIGNTCQNRLIIKGSASELNKFVADNMDSARRGLSIHKHFLPPARYNEEEAYYWKIENLGMAKDIDKFCVAINWTTNNSSKKRSISFLSENIPSYPWFFQIVNNYPKINFELQYIDVEAQKYGSFIIKDSVLSEVNKNDELVAVLDLLEAKLKKMPLDNLFHNLSLVEQMKNTKQKELVLFLQENNEITNRIHRHFHKSNTEMKLSKN
jgi:hypothetical protein